MDIIDSLEWRYACKKFDEKLKLSDDQLNTLKKAFNLTATSFGLQPVKMLIITDNETKGNIFKYSYFQKQITTCSHLFVLCINTVMDDETIDSYFELEKEIRGTSEEIISKFRNQLKQIYKGKSQNEIEQSAINQAYIILGNLMTVCAVEGIDSCPMEGFIPEKVDEILGLADKNLKSILMLPVGFRAEDDFMKSLKKVRKPIENLIFEDVLIKS
ncbi:NAD(P)H-dependent oxidoreductase [Namhaeicola litoreus]|uniref:NAD(P)H-dependent oxidoreductase n=1 Tax=Namhaeicola litoreus TaxID=1052145 RepID=A0ABW3Y197_9FLAO